MPEPTAHDYPLVSVVVTVYNHAPYIKACLDSIIATGYPNLELIIINDVSPDGADRIIQQWVDEHRWPGLIYINHERNVGLTRSLNEAIRLCHGEYFRPIDGDDMVLPNGIIDLVEYLEAHRDKLAVFADCHVIDEAGRQVYASAIAHLWAKLSRRKDLVQVDALIPSLVVFDYLICGPVFMCRTETFRIVGPYDEAQTIEDWDLCLRLAARQQIGYRDGYVGKYRMYPHNQNLTGGYVQSWHRIAKKHIGLFSGIEALHLRAEAMKWKHKGATALVPRALYYFSSALMVLLTYLFYARGVLVLLGHRRRP